MGLGGITAFYIQIDRFCAQRDADLIVSGAGTAMCLYYVDRGEGGREGGREGRRGWRKEGGMGRRLSWEQSERWEGGGWGEGRTVMEVRMEVRRFTLVSNQC